MTVIHNFVRMPYDTRDTASSTIAATFSGKGSAKKLAKEIETIPDAWHQAVEDGLLIPVFPLSEGGRVVPGHGTMIAYDSGRKVTVWND